MEKKYRVHLMVCAGTSCVSGGSLDLRDALVEEIHKNALQDEILVATTGCNGFCAAGPLMIAYPDKIFYQKLKVEDVPYFVEEYLIKGRVVKKHLFESPEAVEGIPKISEIGFFSRQVLVALKNRGLIDPENIDEYIARDGYTGAAKALHEMTPAEIVEEMKTSGSGVGEGQAFPRVSSGSSAPQQKEVPSTCSAMRTRETQAPSWTDRSWKATPTRSWKG